MALSATTYIHVNRFSVSGKDRHGNQWTQRYSQGGEPINLGVLPRKGTQIVYRVVSDRVSLILHVSGNVWTFAEVGTIKIGKRQISVRRSILITRDGVTGKFSRQITQWTPCDPTFKL